MHTALLKQKTNKDLLTAQETYSGFCNNLYGERIRKEWIYVQLNYLAIHLKLTPHCKSTILQYDILKNK